MRSYLIAGNWKMNTTVDTALQLASAIATGLQQQPVSSNVEIEVFPPFVNISTVMSAVAQSSIRVGAQNCSSQPYGAYTGEISVEMLQSIGCTSVLIGHSERRHLFHESESLITDKLRRVLASRVRPILCIGESLEQRQQNQTWQLLSHQLDTALGDLDAISMENIVIAYEPVWAIGTGVAASPMEAQEAHAFIRKHCETLHPALEKRISVLYGGSVTADNATSLLQQKDIDGALIGGASLKAESFLSIIRQAERCSVH